MSSFRIIDPRAKRPAILTFGLGAIGSLITVAVTFTGYPTGSGDLLLSFLVMSVVLSMVQMIDEPPDGALMAFAGPRHLIMAGIGIGIAWITKELGVDYSRYAGKVVQADKVWLCAGGFAGYASAMFYVIFYIGCNGEEWERHWD